MERLQKFLSRAGISSRRKAEEYILNGRVKVNGKKIIELGSKIDPIRDRVEVDNQLVRINRDDVYLLFYKPRGVITSLHDPQGRKTIMHFLEDVTRRVHPVGRLDYNTDGLLLLTSDGELTQALVHPSKKIDKTYIACVEGIPSEDKISSLCAGIELEDGWTAPAQVERLEKNEEENYAVFQITIHEGRNRQIRRMFEAVGHPVTKLRRIKFAFLTLEGIRRGQYRSLTKDEIQRLKALAAGKKKS